MNLPLRTFGKRTGPILPTIGRYPYHGMGDVCIETDPDTGECLAYDPASLDTPLTPINVIANQPPIDLVPSPVGTTLNLPSGNAPIAVVDSSGVTWTCDQSGNCCDPSDNCQAGPPAISTGANASAASGTQSNSANASLVQALATAASKIAGASTIVGGGSVQCGNGVAVPAGQRCPTGATPGIFGCPSGSAYVNGICQGGAAKPIGQWFAGMSNTQALAIGGTVVLGIAVIAAIARSGGGRRRR